MGDIILTTPVASALRKRFPEAEIDFLVDPAFSSILEYNPSIDRIQQYDRNHVSHMLRHLRAQHYDVVFDFQSSPRSVWVAITSGAPLTVGYGVPFWGRFYKQALPRPRGSESVVRGKFSLLRPWLGSTSGLPKPEIILTPEEKRWAEGVLSKQLKRPVVGLITTHRRESRRWLAESFAALGQILLDQGLDVWLFWGPGEKEYVEKIQNKISDAHMIPSSTLRQMAALLAQCQFVVTNDNGPMHMAVAVGTPTVTLYGPTDPASWNPGGPNHHSVQAKGLSCLGCNLNTCPFDHECMALLTPAEVWKACQEAFFSALVK